MAKDRKDLDVLLGEPKRAIRSLAVPLSVSYLITQVNMFVDSVWTTSLGSNVASAIATITPIYWMIMAGGTGLGVGASSTIAYRLGQRNNQKANELAANALFLGLVVSVFASVIVFFAVDPVITLMGAGDIRSECNDYVMPYILMSWILILNGIVSGLLRAEGAGRKSMIVLALTAIFNMILDPVLIYGMGLGIYGAAWATSLAALAATVLGLLWYALDKMQLRLGRDSFVITKSNMMEVLQVGAPKTAESLVNNTTNILQRIFIIMGAGTIGVMLYNLPWRFVGLAVVPIEALGAAVIPVCSAAIGQRRYDKMFEGMRYSAKLALTILVGMSVFLFIFAEPLMSLFTYSDSMLEQKDMLVWTLRVYCLLIPPYGFYILGSSMLQALKRSLLATEIMMAWGVLKLILFFIACHYSFEAIIYALVFMHFLSGSVMMTVAFRTARTKAREAGVLSAV